MIVSLRAQHLDQLVDRGRRPARRSRGAELHAAALGRRQVGRRLLHRLQGVLCVQEMILLDKNKINAIGLTWMAQILTPSCRVLQRIARADNMTLLQSSSHNLSV